jgi:hypothetical protein
MTSGTSSMILSTVVEAGGWTFNSRMLEPCTIRKATV